MIVTIVWITCNAMEIDMTKGSRSQRFSCGSRRSDCGAASLSFPVTAPASGGGGVIACSFPGAVCRLPHQLRVLTWDSDVARRSTRFQPTPTVLPGCVAALPASKKWPNPHPFFCVAPLVALSHGGTAGSASSDAAAPGLTPEDIAVSGARGRASLAQQWGYIGGLPHLT